MINLKKKNRVIIGPLLAAIGILLMSATYYFAPTWTHLNLWSNPRALVADSVLIVPRQTGFTLSPQLGRDSTGAIFYHSGSNRFYGRFNTGVKPFATEDSLGGLNLDRVLFNGNTTGRNFAFTDTTRFAWSVLTEQAKIQLFTKGDETNTSNLVFQMGDNPSRLLNQEGFVFIKDTAATTGATVAYDTLLKMNDYVIKMNAKNNANPAFWYLNRFTGRMGINTELPTSAFTVNGDINVLNGSSVAVTSGSNPAAGGASSLVMMGTGTNVTSGYVSMQSSFGGVGFTAPFGINANGGNIGLGTNTPGSKVSFSGSINYPVLIQSTNGNLGEHYYVVCTNTSTITLNLPTLGVVAAGRTYVFKKNSNTASVVLTPPSGVQIEGATTYTFSTALSSRTIFYDGTNWWVL